MTTAIEWTDTTWNPTTCSRSCRSRSATCPRSRDVSAGGTFKEYLSALRRNELVDEQGGLLGLTDAGLAGTDASPEPLTRGEVLALWTPSLKAGARAMLDVVLATPGGLARAELGERVGFVASGGTFKEYLSALRRAGLVDVDREHVRVSATLPP